MDELRCKEVIISSRNNLWIYEDNQLTLSVQGKLKGIQQTERMMGLAVEDPTTKKLVEEVCQAATQGKTDL